MSSPPPELRIPLEGVRTRLGQLLEEGEDLRRKAPLGWGALNSEWQEGYGLWRNRVRHVLRQWFSTEEVVNQFLAVAPAPVRSTYESSAGILLETHRLATACRKEVTFLYGLRHSLGDYVPIAHPTSEPSTPPIPLVSIGTNYGPVAAAAGNQNTVTAQTGADLNAVMRLFDRQLRLDVQRGLLSRDDLDDWELIEEEVEKDPASRRLRALGSALGRLQATISVGTKLYEIWGQLEPLLRSHIPQLPGL